MGLSVLSFSNADTLGGSARSAYRIHQGLRQLGHRSRMLVKTKCSRDPDVDTVTRGGMVRRADWAADLIGSRVGLQYQLVPSSRRVLRHPWLTDADIIQLYNVHGGYFGLRTLPALSRRAPIVWRLSDMWPVTGHCAYSGDCDRWRTGCGSCPDLSSYPPLGIDTTAWLWKVKRRQYGKSRLTIVAPSSWIENVAKASPLFADLPVHRIPNGLDQSVFRPVDRGAAREVFRIDPDCKAILFSAHVAYDNPRKGTHLLLEALHRLGPRPDVQVLVAGVDSEQWSNRLPQPVVSLGFLDDDRLIAAANSAADAVVVPSTVENLPNGIIEAMSCARPVVAFDAGGIRDAVKDEQTGLLVPPGDTHALALALSRMIEDDELRARTGEAALKLARREFCADRQARRFESLYTNVLDEAARGIHETGAPVQ